MNLIVAACLSLCLVIMIAAEDKRHDDYIGYDFCSTRGGLNASHKNNISVLWEGKTYYCKNGDQFPEPPK